MLLVETVAPDAVQLQQQAAAGGSSRAGTHVGLAARVVVPGE
jgi:hypothetical protein